MSKKFKQLLVPEGYRHYWSKYPEGYTILEALLNWVDSVNQLTENVNDWNIYLDDFVENFDDPNAKNLLFTAQYGVTAQCLNFDDQQGLSHLKHFASLVLLVTNKFYKSVISGIILRFYLADRLQ